MEIRASLRRADRISLSKSSIVPDFTMMARFLADYRHDIARHRANRKDSLRPPAYTRRTALTPGDRE